MVGSLIFGAGWGLAGFCPGPGIVTMASGELKAALFVAAMVVGMLGFQLLDRAGRQRNSQAEARPLSAPAGD